MDHSPQLNRRPRFIYLNFIGFISFFKDYSRNNIKYYQSRIILRLFSMALFVY